MPEDDGRVLRVGGFNKTINLDTFEKVEAFDLHARHHVIIARNKKARYKSVALRLRVGRVGYAQWLNEMHVYLMPKFKHKNILPFLGCDKRYPKEGTKHFTADNALEDDERDLFPYNSDSDDSDLEDRSEEEPGSLTTEWRPTLERGAKRQTGDLDCMVLPIEYWLVNDFRGSITLRHFLERTQLTWAKMIMIARGIANGLHYLHEHHIYHNSDTEHDAAVAEALERESNHLLKDLFYPSKGAKIKIRPPNLITIVHRTLNSLNIVIRDGKTPCIWNFGTAHVYHPYQPVNYPTIMDKPNKDLIMNSVYTPPEILRTSSMFTPHAYKAVDCYALGIIYWELISRCKLPLIKREPRYEELINAENEDRAEPQEYSIPFSRELKTEEFTCQMLYENVCLKRMRPTLRSYWTLGKLSHRFVKIIRDLWDQDHEARIQVATVIERLAVIDPEADLDKLVQIFKEPLLKPVIFASEPHLDPSKMGTEQTPNVPSYEQLARTLDENATLEDLDQYEVAFMNYLKQHQEKTGRKQQVSRRRRLQLEVHMCQTPLRLRRPLTPEDKEDPGAEVFSSEPMPAEPMPSTSTGGPTNLWGRI